MTGSTGQLKCQVCDKIIDHKKNIAQNKERHGSTIM